MPRRVHHTPFVIHPPDDLAQSRPELARAAARLAHNYRLMSEGFERLAIAAEPARVIDDGYLEEVGRALWDALACKLALKIHGIECKGLSLCLD